MRHTSSASLRAASGGLLLTESAYLHNGCDQAMLCNLDASLIEAYFSCYGFLRFKRALCQRVAVRSPRVRLVRGGEIRNSRRSLPLDECGPHDESLDVIVEGARLMALENVPPDARCALSVSRNGEPEPHGGQHDARNPPYHPGEYELS